jgi:hypothetical protein
MEAWIVAGWILAGVVGYYVNRYSSRLGKAAWHLRRSRLGGALAFRGRVAGDRHRSGALRLVEGRDSRFSREVHLAARSVATTVGPEDAVFVEALSDTDWTALPGESQQFLARLFAEPVDEDRYADCLMEGLEASAA